MFAQVLCLSQLKHHIFKDVFPHFPYWMYVSHYYPSQYPTFILLIALVTVNDILFTWLLTISHMKTNTLPALFLACSQNEQIYNWRTVRTRSAVINDNLSTTSISFPNYLWIFSLEAEKESGGERKSLTKPSSAKYLCCHHVLWRVGCRLNDICNESKTLDGHINSLYSIKDD